MNKTQLKKIKELDAFLKEKNMELSGNNIAVAFNRHKYHLDEEFFHLNLDLGLIRESYAYIQELNALPKVKERYYIDKTGKLKSYK